MKIENGTIAFDNLVDTKTGNPLTIPFTGFTPNKGSSCFHQYEDINEIAELGSQSARRFIEMMNND